MRNGKRGSISWLQISDLHIFESTDWNIMQDAYLELNHDHPIRFILVTGDLHQWGEDYSKTKFFLENLLKCYGLKKADIFIIPGNHDAGNCEDKEAYISYIDQHIDQNQDCYCKYYRDGKLKDCFRAFNQFMEDFYGKPRKGATYDDVFVAKWKGLLNILQLNTSIICNGDNTRKQIVDINRLSKLCDKVDTELPSIVIAHHAFDCVCPRHQETLQRIFTSLHVCAYLCGDLHKGRVAPIQVYSGQKFIPCIVCGKSAVEASDTYSDVGCIVYTAEEGEVYPSPYRWNNQRKRFEPDCGFDADNSRFAFPMRMEPREQREEKTMKAGGRFSVWLPDAEKAKGKQTRFDDCTRTRIIEEYLSPSSGAWGIAAVKGIGKTFVLQVKRTKCRGRLCLPVGISASPDNNWATECITFDKGVDFSGMKDFDFIVMLWKYAIVVYTINQCVNYSSNVKDKSRVSAATNDAIEKMRDLLNDLYHKGKIDILIYELCLETRFSSLKIIMRKILKEKNCVKLAGDQYTELESFLYSITKFLETIKKKSVAVFIDKVDQAIKLVNAEPPADCASCEKSRVVETCGRLKSVAFCSAETTACNATCCFGCEIFASPQSNLNLRIYEEGGETRYQHVNLWQHLQLGLVDAVAQIQEEFSGKIEVYYTIRQEAFASEVEILGEHEKKIIKTVEQLWYTKEEQRRIYRECIGAQNDELLYNPALKKIPGREDEAFVGVSALCHPYVHGLQESVFESIYRHSFDRSRDIQLYGEVLTNHLDEIRSCKEEKKRGEKVKDIIEKTAARLAYDNSIANESVNGCYYMEKIKFLPNYWALQHNFEDFILRIDRNLLFFEDVKKVCCGVNGLESCSGNCKETACSYHPFSMLYSLGMLGQMYINNNNDEDITQKFLHSKEITYIKEKATININQHSLYILHPALAKSIEAMINEHIKHFSGFILGKDIRVSKPLLTGIMSDHNTLDKEVFEKRYYFQPDC